MNMNTRNVTLEYYQMYIQDTKGGENMLGSFKRSCSPRVCERRSVGPLTPRANGKP